MRRRPTLYEVGFNHFFRAPKDDFPGDQLFIQGHGAPGIYARAYIERRINAARLLNFRREMAPSGGLSSYPHPRLMPEFWQFPTVSMGLGAINSIYQARFNEYLHDRGIRDSNDAKVWAFLGDGEMDEPESLGAITLASREKLENLIWVVNCNLQRLDGPVRGNGKIIQELEAAFREAGWNVIKVLWGTSWDPIFAADKEGLLIRRFNEIVDGDLQKYSVEPGSYSREHFFGAHQDTLKLVEHMTDEDIEKLRRGGHDPAKVYAAYQSAIDHQGGPTVILAMTVKGYGLGEAGEGRNVTHQQKKLNDEELRHFRDRFDIPIPDKDLPDAPFYRPSERSEEYQYLRERRESLNGFVPQRRDIAPKLKAPSIDIFKEFLAGSDGREASTTMAYVRMLAALLRDKEVGQLVVPIVPDEARTFGMEALFRKHGIYAHGGQLYEPVDSHLLLYYREARDGQILEEGITEAGSMASFIAAGSAYSTHAINTIPFFIYYSMFGFQRIGDMAWLAADQRCRGFMLGATAGRTTLAGEGLQHQDGHSHLLAMSIPTLMAYDPAYAYEVAVILQDGIRRMYEVGEDIFYYITLGNEPYAMPPMPEGSAEGILRGAYKVSPAEEAEGKPRVHLLGSGAILRQAMEAQELLSLQYGVAADVWSVTSYKELRRDATEVDRWNRLHPGETPRKPYVTTLFENEPWPVIAASDYMKALPQMIASWIPQGVHCLGTDGFGRSENRRMLRRFFEVDKESITVAALSQLAARGEISADSVKTAITELGLDPDSADPASR